MADDSLSIEDIEQNEPLRLLSRDDISLFCTIIRLRNSATFQKPCAEIPVDNIQSSVIIFAKKSEKKAAKIMHIGKDNAYEITL